jgi:hypothetical protein
MENPMLVVIIGAIGLGLNIISITFLHGKAIFQLTDNYR